ncbi:hypothetical protein MBLNU459_g7205t1 [Dothideomycetes sp. NU459]
MSHHVRNYSLPYRTPEKHVVFSAIVKTDLAPRSIAPLKDEEAKALLDQSQFWQPALEPQPRNYTFDTVPTLVRTPWELERSSRRWSRSSKGSSESQKSQASTFLSDILPDEICGYIVDHVAAEHNASPNVCPDCISQDMYSLSLVSKAFNESATRYLYRDIWLPSYQFSRDSRTMGVRRRNRLRSLLRTLLKRPDLASQIRRLRASDEHRGMYATDGDLSDTLAAIILACPNLESLHGLYPTQYCPTEKFSVVTSALATRKALKEHVWMINGRPEPTEHHIPSPSRPRSTSFLHVVDPSIDFIQVHGMWKKLETLIICATDAHLLGPATMYGVLAKLPALKHLMLSGLPAHVCHDGTLQSLKGLSSLRLENLSGVTDQGLERLAYSRVALSLRSLSLIALDIKSLRTVSRIFASFPHLSRFTLLQDTSPGLPLGAEVSFALNTPVLVSSSIEHLHWDILVPGSANEALAHSVRTNGLPALRSLRAPCDCDGSLQALCRPVPRRSLTRSTVQAYKHEEDVKAYTRNLAHARAAAQLRIRNSRQLPGGVSLVVQDEGDAPAQTIPVGGYLGSMESGVEYCLEPDFEGAEEAVGRIEDLYRVGGIRDICENWERKGRKGHVGRNKERMLDLGQLF